MTEHFRTVPLFEVARGGVFYVDGHRMTKWHELQQAPGDAHLLVACVLDNSKVWSMISANTEVQVRGEHGGPRVPNSGGGLTVRDGFPSLEDHLNSRDVAEIQDILDAERRQQRALLAAQHDIASRLKMEADAGLPQTPSLRVVEPMDPVQRFLEAALDLDVKTVAAMLTGLDEHYPDSLRHGEASLVADGLHNILEAASDDTSDDSKDIPE